MEIREGPDGGASRRRAPSRTRERREKLESFPPGRRRGECISKQCSRTDGQRRQRCVGGTDRPAWSALLNARQIPCQSLLVSKWRSGSERRRRKKWQPAPPRAETSLEMSRSRAALARRRRRRAVGAGVMNSWWLPRRPLAPACARAARRKNAVELGGRDSTGAVARWRSRRGRVAW